jgi:hypothetical protein
MDSEFIAALRTKDVVLAKDDAELEIQAAKIEKMRRDISAARAGIQALLKTEGAEPVNTNITPGTADLVITNRPLLSILTEVLSDGKPRSTAELAKGLTAKGVRFGQSGDSSPLRVIHATLMGASRTSGAFNKLHDKWQIGHSQR